jgi:hypothetical protein
MELRGYILRSATALRKENGSGLTTPGCVN